MPPTLTALLPAVLRLDTMNRRQLTCAAGAFLGPFFLTLADSPAAFHPHSAAFLPAVSKALGVAWGGLTFFLIRPVTPGQGDGTQAQIVPRNDNNDMWGTGGDNPPNGGSAIQPPPAAAALGGFPKAGSAISDPNAQSGVLP